MAKVSYQGAKMLPLGEETQQPASPGLPVHHRTKELTAEDPPAPGDRGGCVPDHGILQNAKHRALLQVIDSIDRRPRPRLPAIGIKRQVSPGMIPTGQCPGEQIQLIHGNRSGTVVFHHQPPEEQRLVRVNRGFQPQGNSMDILRLAVRRAFQAAVRRGRIAPWLLFCWMIQHQAHPPSIPPVFQPDGTLQAGLIPTEAYRTTMQGDFLCH